MNGLALINLSYVFAAVFFILGLKMLSSPATARRGNLFSSLGMLIAIVATLLGEGIVEFQWIALGFVVGGMVGALAAPWDFATFSAMRPLQNTTDTVPTVKPVVKNTMLSIELCTMTVQLREKKISIPTR